MIKPLGHKKSIQNLTKVKPKVVISTEVVSDKKQIRKKHKKAGNLLGQTHGVQDLRDDSTPLNSKKSAIIPLSSKGKYRVSTAVYKTIVKPVISDKEKKSNKKKLKKLGGMLQTMSGTPKNSVSQLKQFLRTI